MYQIVILDKKLRIDTELDRPSYNIVCAISDLALASNLDIILVLIETILISVYVELVQVVFHEFRDLDAVIYRIIKLTLLKGSTLIIQNFTVLEIDKIHVHFTCHSLFLL